MKPGRMNLTQCTRCSREVPGHEGVEQSDGRGGSLGFVCGRCWTNIISDHRGEAIGHVEVAPLTLTDAAHGSHVFHFRFNPSPRSLKAFELLDGVPGGYGFGVIAEENEPTTSLVGRLVSRIREALARQHLEPCDITQGGLRIKGEVVRGRIELDDHHDLPVAVVDGASVPWLQFGKMLMNYEGWQFRLEMVDPYDEL